MSKRSQTSPRDQRRLIDVHDAATRLGCSVWTVRRMVAEGDLTGYKLGYRMMRVDEAELASFIDACRVPTVATSPNPRPGSGCAEPGASSALT